MKPERSRIHDEPEYVNFADSDPARTWQPKSASISAMWKKGFAEADRDLRSRYEVPKVQQAHIEPHVVRHLLG